MLICARVWCIVPSFTFSFARVGLICLSFPSLVRPGSACQSGGNVSLTAGIQEVLVLNLQ